MTAGEHIEQLLRQTMGLTAESVGALTIQRAVQDRMADRGARGVDEYWAMLTTTRGELDELIERVVVPETWFFRYPEAFSALSHVVQTSWMPAHPGGVLRVLSAPCSTGEEPYSIAIALEECGMRPERFAIDAVDISTRSLAFARRGVYGANSFRGSDAGVRERYCRLVGSRYELVDVVRKRVQFHQVNLVRDDFVAPNAPYDVVFCRNLLIYFDRPTQERVLDTLRAVMAPDGYLFVGPAEAPVTAERGFKPLRFAMAFAYQNSEAAGAAGTAGAAPPATSTVRKAVRNRAAPPRRAPVRPATTGNVKRVNAAKRAHAPAPPPAALPASGRDVALAAARALADGGRLDAAAEAIDRVLRDHGAAADAYALLGVVRDATGDRRAAETCYRKALFLDPANAEAASHLAALLRAQGNAVDARRLEARARRADGAA